MASSNVVIYGDSYKISTDDVNEEFVSRVESYLNKKMSDIAAQTSSKTTQRIAVMAALNITAEFFLLADDVERAKQLVDEIENKLR